MSMDKTSRIGEVWDIGGDDVVHWKVTSRYRVEEWNVECVKPGHGVSVGDEGVIVESWLSKKGARQVRAVPAPAPASGGWNGPWPSPGWYSNAAQMEWAHVTGMNADGVVYEAFTQVGSRIGGGTMKGASAFHRYYVIRHEQAPPWAKQEGAKPAPAPKADDGFVVEYVGCAHCKTNWPTAERILDKHGTRARLCDPCYVARERVAFPAGAPVEGPRETTWAPGTGPGTRVAPFTSGVPMGWYTWRRG